MLILISDFPEWCAFDSTRMISYIIIYVSMTQYFYILLQRRDSYETGNSSGNV